MDKRIFGDNLPQNNILYWNTEKNIKINQSINQFINIYNLVKTVIKVKHIQ